MMQHLDPHQRPPDSIRNAYKRYQKMKPEHLVHDEEVVDLSSEPHAPLPPKIRLLREVDAEGLTVTFETFAGDFVVGGTQHMDAKSSVCVYKHEDIPGLRIIPSLLLPEVQTILLSRLLHRDLSNPIHLTNIHTHYDISYPSDNASFFSLPPASPNAIATPFDPSVHKPLTIAQIMNKKMRWTTLGGQYDWTAKQYPATPPPAFPSDIKNLLENIFIDTKAEAAIVNLYSPGDTLSVHRDVAETSSHGLISVSLGCDAIFVIGTKEKVVILRLRSGSALYMSGASRFAWHGVPQIVAGSCPEHLRDWPAGSQDDNGVYEGWKGWMANKRVNLNVRQMWD